MSEHSACEPFLHHFVGVSRAGGMNVDDMVDFGAFVIRLIPVIIDFLQQPLSGNLPSP